MAAVVAITALWLVADSPTRAQFQIGIGSGGGTIGDDRGARKEDHAPRKFEKNRDEPRRQELRKGEPSMGIQLNIGVGDVRPAYCYTHKFGGVITCKKRSLDGETCTGECILSGDGTVIGPAPPAHRMADGVSYRCQCGN